ncbi:histone-like nucleoid-structuring protein Lsr2 [Streptomyces sp. NPDC006193]|uniref:Lsr2 family DNA-binding protein n=1 Tax=Streptomyces sp. NPDC006193 TaxID=3155717 RepID=UPI0033B4B5DF
MTIAALRRLLDEIDRQGGPEAARESRLHLNEGTPVTTSVDADETPEQLPVGKLLAWGDQHTDPDVQDQAARARAALVGLRQRYAADRELAAIASEREQLERRLAEIRAREAELVPVKAKKSRKSVDYPAAEVRAWAREHGMHCPPVGRVPRDVVEAWRALQ